MTALVGTLIEAVDEIRIHKLRVGLALLGIGLAIAVMTAAIALGQQVAQVNREFNEKMNGRDVTLTVEPQMPDVTKLPDAVAAIEDFVERHEIAYASRVMNAWNSFTTDTAFLPDSEMLVVDPDFAVIRRLEPITGDWFGEGDAQRLAPALVVNEAFLSQAGAPADLSQQPPNLRMRLMSGEEVSFVIIGVVEDQWDYDTPRAYVLWDALANALGSEKALFEKLGGWAQYQMWLGPGDATIAQQALPAEVQPLLGEGAMINAWPSSGEYDPTQAVRDIVFWIGIAVLALGAISLVNLQLVTVQQRVREIGIRRSFGAASSRVFASIVLESVVGTFLAGVVGVALAIWALGQFPILEMMGFPIQDTPAFPMGTAVLGILAATGVGALAGLLPGIVATRIRPIEAMRA